ncbi:MAG: bacillithiol biosynthesis deacetylase BshB1 [Planctomycetaceae bacterium]|jgi:N-acetylglucosamine malate deacetylase 1|nr:bacillithiol biosynthesis deacetylase BshB1 [Planctomycetaceae bacterium]MDG2391794.1 bacillithiol biosynthesis deacetylase BshB1 [Planctomycetaceae bacterium]
MNVRQMPTLDSPLDLLVVAPHPDDAEISVGGIIASSRAEGLRVGVIDLTSGEPTPHGTLELRKQETDRATEILDLTWRGNLDLPNRSLENTLEARRNLAEVFRLTRPQIILAPYWEDSHPDHVVACRLVEDARFWSKLSCSDFAGEPFLPPKLYHFLSVHLRVHPSPSFVYDISAHIETKMQAVHAFESQVLTGRSTEFPTGIDDVKDRARYWGWTINKAYAEPLYSREEIGVGSLKTFL